MITISEFLQKLERVKDGFTWKILPGITYDSRNMRMIRGKKVNGSPFYGYCPIEAVVGKLPCNLWLDVEMDSEDIANVIVAADKRYPLTEQSERDLICTKLRQEILSILNLHDSMN